MKKKIEEVTKEKVVKYKAIQNMRDDEGKELKTGEEVIHISKERTKLLLEYKIIERVEE